MTLSGDHVETADASHFITLSGNGNFGLCHGCLPGCIELIGGVHWIKTALGQFSSCHCLSVSAEHDVGASTGHVGGYGHRILASSLSDDGCFALVELGVQDFVRNPTTAQHLGQVLRLLHTRRTHQNGLTLFVAFHDVINNGCVLR